MLDRILRGEHQKWLVQPEALSADGDLLLLHRLEQRALDLGRGAIDLVGKDDVPEDGAALNGELARLLVVDDRSDEIRGEQIRRELNPLEAAVDHRGESSDGECLGQAREPLEQHVPVGEQPDHQAVEHGPLADDDRLERGFDSSHERIGGAHAFIERAELGFVPPWGTFGLRGERRSCCH